MFMPRTRVYLFGYTFRNKNGARMEGDTGYVRGIRCRMNPLMPKGEGRDQDAGQEMIREISISPGIFESVVLVSISICLRVIYPLLAKPEW